MLVGRARKKAVSQVIAGLAFRWLVLWCIAAFCASKGPNGQIAALLIVAIDVIISSSFHALAVNLEERERKDWVDRLTDRIFYELFYEQLYSRKTAFEIPRLFRIASERAVEDIKTADTDDIAAADLLGSTTWAWFGGLAHFVWKLTSCALFYGSAIVVGSS